MTDLDLQNALIRELEELVEHQSLKKLDGEVWKDFHIYRQDKPYKNDDAADDADADVDDDQEDYIIVMLDNEDTDEDGRWIVDVHMLISIRLFEEEHQGNLILATLMNQIDLHLSKKGIIAGRYEMELEKHKRFNQECYPNYYECDFITRWKLPAVNMEGIEELI
ncbi:MAG: hypothetical protein NC417_09000 [Candidatus Gastranaerophilales bacterium]|nr:hypothetical protein [Candidatus Gastranaerophilales bacterium]